MSVSLFQFIKTHISILTVISDYTQLKRAGVYWKGNCPFHQERTASFTVSPHKDIFYCFGCHVGGDVVAFIEKAEHCSALEAVHHLADRYRIELPKDLVMEKGAASHDQKKSYSDLCALVAQWAHAMLLKTPFAIHYVKKRGLSDMSIQQYTVGYFPTGVTAMQQLITLAHKAGFVAEDLMNANIIAQGKTFFYSPFENRILFPIRDHLSRFCGFGGRVFKQDDERAKYVNSKEGPFFAKGSLLFGLDFAKKTMQQTAKVFLVEGYLDCITMVQHGYTNTVATLGTACTLEHLTQLARYAQEVFIAYDADKAGKQATLRLAQLCWQVNLDLHVVSLPSGEDPASYLAQHQTLQPLVEKAVDIFDFFIESTSEGFTGKNLNQKVSVAQTLLESIKMVQDPLKQSILLQKMAQKLDLPLAALQVPAGGLGPSAPKRAVIKQSDPHPVSPKESVSAVPGRRKTAESVDFSVEKKIFFAIMNNVSLLNASNEEYLEIYLSEPLRVYVQKLIVGLKERAGSGFREFFDTLAPVEQQELSRLLLEHDEEVSEADFHQLLLHLQKKHWKVAVSTIQQQLQAISAEDVAAAEKVLHNFTLLKKIIVKGS